MYLVARFSGTDRDGHGHHQASSILAREAFRAAADPKRFPEQIAQGLQPWQVRKLYKGNVCGFGASTCPDADWTLKLNTGEKSDALGMSYVQFAMQGLRHQMSQGAANWTVEPGDRFTFYKLVDSVEPPHLDKDNHEKDFLDGIDTTLPGLAARLGAEETKVPWLKGTLSEIADSVKQASEHCGGDGNGAVKPLFEVSQKLDFAIAGLQNAKLSDVSVSPLLEVLEEKRQEAEVALSLALDVTMTATVTPAKGPGTGLPKEADALTAVSPGQNFEILVKLHNGSKDYLTVRNARLERGADWVKQEHAEIATIAPGEDYYANFLLSVPQGAQFTRPYWHRDNPDIEAVNTVDEERYATLPFPPSPLYVRAEYEIAGRRGLKSPAPDFVKKLRKSNSSNEPAAGIGAEVWVPFLNEQGKRQKRTLAIVPAFSVMVEPGTQVISIRNGSASTVTVGATSNLTREARGVLRLELPEGWRSEPAQFAVDFAKRGSKQDFQFESFVGGIAGRPRHRSGHSGFGG